MPSIAKSLDSFQTPFPGFHSAPTHHHDYYAILTHPASCNVQCLTHSALSPHLGFRMPRDPPIQTASLTSGWVGFYQFPDLQPKICYKPLSLSDHPPNSLVWMKCAFNSDVACL